jgi:hypothetical protein
MITLQWAIITPELVLNPGGPKSAAGTPYSVSDFISNDTDELLREAATKGFGKHKQSALKTLVCRQVR